MSDLLEIRMPADQTEGTRSQVLRWLKAEGDAVTQDEPLIEMETDKVTVEIAAPGSGAANPGFDVTPARLVTGLITERGTCAATPEGLRSLFPKTKD